jgi:GMC oxidoreductase
LSGDAGWGWDDLVPYFRKQEGNVRLENAAHSGDGPLKVSDPAYISEAANIFVRTLQKLKVPFTDDFTGGQLHGVGYEQSTTFRGKRRSSADSFLRPVIGDARLTLVTEARANRVLFDGQRAIGIEYVKHGKVHQAKATHEVVLTAGALATPKLLMLSGHGRLHYAQDHQRQHERHRHGGRRQGRRSSDWDLHGARCRRAVTGRRVGRVQQTNFDTYQMLRMNEAPAIEVHIVQNSEPPGGMGEPGTSAIIPAVTNAIFAVTAKRLRILPIDTNLLKFPS